MNKARLIIVDDHQLVIDGMTSLVSHLDTIELVGTFSKPKDAMLFLEKNMVELVIIDISMPELNGIEFINNVRKWNNHVKFIVVTMHDEPKMVQKANSAGVEGYVLKSAEYDVLLTAITEVLNGNRFFDSDVKPILQQGYTPTAQTDEGEISISKRELNVLELIADGLTTVEIAERLFISKHTVNSHRKNLGFKFGTSRPIELLAKAKELGFI